MTISSLNFSLSDRCTAKCTWCPTTRGTKNNMDMPFDLVKKLVDEAASSDFPWKVHTCQVGENGEALYNENFLDILRYIRIKLPETRIVMANNFTLMSSEISKIILEEKLLDSILLNIDGHTKESYKAVKGVNYKVVIKNLKDFITNRHKYNPSFDLSITALPLLEYASGVKSFFGKMPHNLVGDIPYSTFKEIELELRKFVPKDIPITKSPAFFWAERPQVSEDIDQSMYSCPLISRVENEVFVAPSGTWYPCCFDDNHDQGFDNLNNKTLVEIYNSEKRKEFISRLKNKEFKEIGYPCSKVITCQLINVDRIFPELAKKVIPITPV